MQNTLLGIAILLILALVAALVGPSFVDWNNHRAFFEEQASKLTGLPVRVTGAIDVKILPTPSMTLRAIEIGNANDESRLRAAALAMTLGLGSLMRGELKAVDVRLIGPELGLKLNQSGALEMPRMAMGIRPDTVAIDNLNVEQGRAILTDASSGVRVVVDKISFKGQVRSLAGPYRGEGSFVIDDARYGYRIATTRMAEEGLKFKLGVDTDRSLTIEADGLIALDQDSPRFEGNLLLTRPVGAARPTGRAVVNEPWRATSKVKITSAGALFEQIEFNYGPEERAVKLDAAAELKFGAQARLQGSVSARHIDIDRLIVKPDLLRPQPLVAIKTFAETFQGMLPPSLPTRLTLNVDAVTLGGSTLQAVNCELIARGQIWELERLEFRAPGFTQVSVNGRLENSSRGLGFAGFADVNAADSASLIGWLTGRGNPTPGPIKGFSASGDVALSSERIAVEKLKSKYDQAALEGRFDYAWAIGDRPSHIDAVLSATSIDIDNWMQGADTIFAGLDLDWPREIALALDIDKARFLGFEARKIAIQLKLDRDGIDLKRLVVDGFNGITLGAAGRIEALASAPRGAINFDLDAREIATVIALADRLAPSLVAPIRRLAGRESTAKLAANFSIDSAASDAKRAVAKVGVQGQIGAYRLNVSASTGAETTAISRLDFAALAAGELRIETLIDSDDGAALLSLLDLDRMATNEKGSGRLKLIAEGALNRDMSLDARFAAGVIDIAGRGSVTLSFDRPVTANFGQVSGTIGGSKVKGRLVVTSGSPVKLDGAIDAESVDVPASVAVLIGTSSQKLRPTDENGVQRWSLEPFAQNIFGVAGRIEVNVARAVLSPTQVARSVQTVVQFGASRSEIEIKDADLGAGRLTGQVSFFSSNEGLSTLSYIELVGAEAAALFSGQGQPPVSGALSLQATIEGAGLSPAAFFGSLRGSGSVSIENAKLSALNPNVFEALTQAVDLGIPADSKQIREFVDIIINGGTLAVKMAEAKLTIAGGLARLSEPKVEAVGADLGVTASLNLSDATMDATLALTGSTALGSTGRPAVTVMLKGPLNAPNYSFNSDTLARWIALRTVEQQSKRVEALEASRRALSEAPIAQPNMPAWSAGRTDDDDANLSFPVSPPARQVPWPTAPAVSATSPIVPVTPETTGGIFGVIPVPQLPPPITIQR